MYLKNNTTLHGITFHHFFNNKFFLKGQGAINQNHFRKLINYIGRENIIDANEFYSLVQKNQYNERKVCFTFDDGLHCQYEIAKPILDEYKIKAFFFIFTSSITNKPDLLELYRYFRIKYYKDINNFYQEFFEIYESICKLSIKHIYKRNNNKIIKQKKIYKFHTKNDLLFRIVRDHYCSDLEYNKIMSLLFKKNNFSKEQILKKLYMKASHIKNLHRSGHVIGGHSHSHFTNMGKRSLDTQLGEYKNCRNILSKTLDVPIYSMSHPCGSYNHNTIRSLRKLDFKMGFDSYLNNKINTKEYNFYLPRQDHSNIFKKMKINIQ